MLKLTQAALVVVTLALVPLAFADEKAKPNAEAPPKPAPALTGAFGGMAGNWACKGKFQKMDGSGEMDSHSTMVMRAELDGFAYSGSIQVAKNAELPNGMKEHLYFAYDSANSKLVEFYADSFGSVGRGTSDGFKGDVMVWDEDGVMMGKVNKSRTTVTRIGPKEIGLLFELQTDGKWAPMGRETCKKG
jgi:hypothetical protein